MGETEVFQPLTKSDRITVILYRAGIALSALIILASAFLALGIVPGAAFPLDLGVAVMILGLHFSVGLSVFFIHLYIGKFHRFLKKLYYVSVVCLAVLFVLGNGNPGSALLISPSFYRFLLMPLSLCLGFITAKEAFCFKLLEGYVLAILVPAYVFFLSVGVLSPAAASNGLAVIALLLLLFTARKIFMPAHYDIGDKSAYQP